MSNSPKILSRQEIERINTEALAAVERGRKALAAARAVREKIGLTDEKLQRAFAALPPDSRAWVSTAVNAGLAALTGPAPVAAKQRPRKARSLV